MLRNPILGEFKGGGVSGPSPPPLDTPMSCLLFMGLHEKQFL